VASITEQIKANIVPCVAAFEAALEPLKQCVGPPGTRLIPTPSGLHTRDGQVFAGAAMGA
jgi:hypothetical protein